MFEFFFKYPWSAFSRGDFVWLGWGPAWVLALLIVAAAAALGVILWRRRLSTGTLARTATVWALQAAFLALLLAMLWQPALSVATLKPQQNIVAVVVDDSRSMGIADVGTSRREAARAALDSMLPALKQRFQVRLYRMGASAERVNAAASFDGTLPATHIAGALRQVVAENGTLPVGAILLLSDGADNSGGIDAETMSGLRARGLPVHTVGFGREGVERDIELLEARVPDSALTGARASATVSFRQRGFSGQKAKLAVRDGASLLAARDIVLGPDGSQQSESVLFASGNPGVRGLSISVDPLPAEENANNNRLTRVMEVRDSKPRILYIEGEPRWEYKFIRRAMDEEKSVHLVSLLRTTQNKNYRQGIAGPEELEDGFPSKPEDLFGYSAIVLGSVEANWMTPAQHDLIREFVDRRGGGLLFLGGRFGLGDGGYNKAPFTDLLPVALPAKTKAYRIEPAYVDLTAAGRDSLLCRLVDDQTANGERWKKLPYLMNWHEVGAPKPGATVLAESIPGNGRNRFPLLVTQNFGRGRVAVFASGGSWRWQMLQPLEDKTHEIFWQQMMRWLVTGTPGPVVLTTSATVLSDGGAVRFRAEVRDKTYAAASDAQVEVRVIGPDGGSEAVALRPDASEPGVFTAEWNAPRAGSYIAEAVAKRGTEELGRGTAPFRREDGVAEGFHTEQNRELLGKLSSQTGGTYFRPSDANRIPAEIGFSKAGISVRQTLDLWNMPVLFLLAILLRATEWGLRRRWGVI